MSQIIIDSEDVATIKNALQVISLASDDIFKLGTINEQVKRIDRLLPTVAYEATNIEK